MTQHYHRWAGCDHRASSLCRVQWLSGLPPARRGQLAIALPQNTVGAAPFLGVAVLLGLVLELLSCWDFFWSCCSAGTSRAGFRAVAVQNATELHLFALFERFGCSSPRILRLSDTAPVVTAHGCTLTTAHHTAVPCLAQCASLCCFPAPSQCCCLARTHRAGQMQAGREVLSLL